MQPTHHRSATGQGTAIALDNTHQLSFTRCAPRTCDARERPSGHPRGRRMGEEAASWQCPSRLPEDLGTSAKGLYPRDRQPQAPKRTLHLEDQRLASHYASASLPPGLLAAAKSAAAMGCPIPIPDRHLALQWQSCRNGETRVI